MIKNIRDLVDLKNNFENVEEELLETIENLNNNEEAEMEINLECGTIFDDGICYDSDLEELINYLKCTIKEREKDILFIDENITISIPYTDIKNRFDESCTDETILFFNELKVVA